MSRSLVFVTQVVDPDDAVLGSAWDLVRGLAGAFDAVTVIGNEVRRVPALPDGVRVVSLGKERGATSWLRGARYERALMQLRRADALLAHMCPDYLTAAAPFAKAVGMRSLLWFAHPRDSLRLRAAEFAADAVLTSIPGAYPRPGSKVRAIGQAIDTDAVTLVPPAPEHPGLELLGLGRTSDSKRYDVAIDALAKVREAGVDARLTIVGPARTANELRVRSALTSQIARLGVGEWVRIEDGVARPRVFDLIGGADALINTTIDGSADKTVFEAMAAGRPVFVSNPVFAELLEDVSLDLRFETGNAGELAARLVAFATARLDRVALGSELRSRVISAHSLEHWARAVREVVDGLVAGS